nr:TPA_asm: m73.6 sORF 2 [Murid betaherpesvirus 1]DBA07827.1 TPA_asm: m73.6 sORF 2 [Murid betaherpesvirus 1]
MSVTSNTVPFAVSNR